MSAVGEARGAEDDCRPIRVLRWTIVLALLLFVPAGMGTSVLNYRLTGSYKLGFVVGGFISAVLLAAFVTLALWRCPRCQRRFVHLNAFWPTKCHHCGLHC